MDLGKYLKNFFSRKKLNKSISWLAFWDAKTIIPDEVNLAPFARLMNCRVGKYTYIKPGCVLKNADIGNFCSIANNVMIGLGQHPTNLISTHPIFYKKTGFSKAFFKHIDFQEEKVTYIGNDVWIGNGALIMDGVHVGDGAIIAARAVVTKDIPPYAVVGGVPAKVLKYRFSNDIILALMELKWWEWKDKEILDVLPVFTKKNVTAKDIYQINQTHSS